MFRKDQRLVYGGLNSEKYVTYIFDSRGVRHRMLYYSAIQNLQIAST